MSAIPVVSIGSRQFAFKTMKKAAEFMTLLSEAQQLERTFHEGNYVYFPLRPERMGFGLGISLETVQSKQFVPQDPDEVPPSKKAAKPLQIELQGGTQCQS